METKTFCTAEEDPCRLDFVYYLKQNVSQTLYVRIPESEAARGGEPIWFGTLTAATVWGHLGNWLSQYVCSHQAGERLRELTMPVTQR